MRVSKKSAIKLGFQRENAFVGLEHRKFKNTSLPHIVTSYQAGVSLHTTKIPRKISHFEISAIRGQQISADIPNGTS
jgi:hypothetical protein